MDAATLPAVAEELLKEIESAFRETSQVPDDLLSAGRTAYQVVGSSGKLYTCYASCHFCTCPAFTFSVLRKGDSLVCKHILAVYLSRAVGACQELTVPDQQLTKLLLPQEDTGKEEEEENTRP